MSKLYFTKTHEWVSVEAGKARVGLSEFAAKELGDLVFIELPTMGQKVIIGGSFCNIESVKAVSESYSPATGIISAVNEQLEASPELINQDPMKTWIAEIEFEKLSEELLSEEEYKQL